MKSGTLVKDRFDRIKTIIAQLEAYEASYVTEVHKNFDALDMEAIESLALKRKNRLLLKEKLMFFVEKYEHMSEQ